MLVPRSWAAIEYQRYPGQAEAQAAPLATDSRFKSAAFLLFAAWCVTVFSLWHSIHYYKPRNRGIANRFIGFFRYAPTRFLIMLTLSLIMIGYETAISFNFDISPMKIDETHTNLPWMYGLGWLPIILVMLVQEVSGYLLPNEDRELVRQRRVRGAEIDQELGITKRPHWWSRLHGNHNLSVQQEITKNVHEIGGRASKKGNAESSIEMGNMPLSSKPTNRTSNRPESFIQVGNNPLHRALANREARKSAQETTATTGFSTSSGLRELQDPILDTKTFSSSTAGRGRSIGNDASSTSHAATSQRYSERSPSTRSTNTTSTLGAPPQNIKSMLDI
jgi:hypothetical protein